MVIYNYDRKTGEYIDQGKARKSPLDDAYLIPAHATAIEPPEEISGFARCFINGSWVQVEDHRSMVFHTGTASPVIWQMLGPLPEDYTMLTPCPHPKWDGAQWIEDETQKTAIFRSEAKSLLEKSDITILRCYESRFPVPESWVNYRAELRAIVSGASMSTVLPTKPDYPGGM